MAYALVGSVGSVSSGTTSVAPSFPQATTAGNLLIAWTVAWGGGSGDTTCSDGNWVKAQGAGAAADPCVWYRANCGAGETAPTFTNNCVSPTVIVGAFAEFSGGATSSPLDKIHVGGSSSVTSPLVETLSAADVAAGQLFVTCFEWLLSKAGTNTTVDTYNNGATASGNLNNDATSTANHYRFAYGITTGNGAADSNSETASSMNITLGRGIGASFKLAGAGGNTYTKAGYGKEHG